MVEKRGRVSRNDALLVSRKNPDRQLRVDTLDPLFVILVRILVERCAEPTATGDDFTPRGSIVLANAAREDQAVQARARRQEGHHAEESGRIVGQPSAPGQPGS